MTKKEKEYYNLYLSISRSCINKPFKLRKNFDGFEEKPEYLDLKKVCRLFAKFPNIKPQLYFKAPYIIYNDVNYFDLHFYATQKAIKTYTIYLKLKQEESPDSEDQLNFIKSSLRFIGMFCIKNNISVDNYLTHKNSMVYTWMKHYKNHDISIYSLFELPGLITSLNNIQDDEKDLFLNNTEQTIFTYKTRYEKSKVAKKLVREGTNKIREFVNKNLKKVSD